MNTLFRGWFGDSADPQGGAAWPEVREWAAKAGHRFAIGRGGEGFVVEANSGGPVFRIEWGPSQRNYITGQELRVRIDIGQANGVQMLAATRVVIDRLEHDVFEQFTEGNETRMDDETPEEMRWVVMYPQVPGNLLGGLRTRFALLSNRPRASMLWLEHGLAGPLQASAAWHEPAVPMVLVVQRGRFVLRMALPEPRVEMLEGGLSLGLAAAAAARQVITEVSRGTINSQRPSTWDPVPEPTAQEAHEQDNA